MPTWWWWYDSTAPLLVYFTLTGCFPCSQIVLMGTPILREENILRTSNVASFQEHPCAQEPCHNGGQCNPQLDSYECVCLSGFSGGHCQSSESPIFLSFDILIRRFPFYAPSMKRKIAVPLALQIVRTVINSFDFEKIHYSIYLASL